MRILIITATTGRSSYLEDTVQSVRSVMQASDWGWEHVIVAPSMQVPVLARQFSRCRVIHEGGRGLYSAVNDGLAGASGDYWTYINDDDVLCAGFLGLLHGAALARSAFIYYGTVVLINGEGVTINEVTRLKWSRFMRGALAGKRSPLNQQGALLPLETITRVGYFDCTLKYAADYDYFFKCAVAGYKFKYINAVVAGFRVNVGQLSENKDAFEDEIERVRQRYPTGALLYISAKYIFILNNLFIYIKRFLLRRAFGADVFGK